MTRRFLDTNILLRYLTRDDEQKAQRSLALLMKVERGEEKVETNLIVVFETIYALQRLYRVPRDVIKELLLNVIRLRGVHLPGKNLCYQALDLYVSKNISFADAYHVAYMNSRGLNEIYSCDTDFDKIAEVIRMEPEEVSFD